MNQSLYNFTHADERMKIYQLLAQHKVVPGNGGPDYEKGSGPFSRSESRQLSPKQIFIQLKLFNIYVKPITKN